MGERDHFDSALFQAMWANIWESCRRWANIAEKFNCS